MKKTFVLLSFILLATGAFAQRGKVTSALNFKDTGKLDKAIEAIEEAVDRSNPKSAKSVDWPRSWEVRGEIMQAVAASNDPNIKKLVSNPLDEALKSYKKALELDGTNRIAKSIKIKLTLLTNDFTNQAVEGFNSEDYATSLKAFESILDMQSLPVMQEDNPGAIDTIIIFNAGLAAFNAGNYDKAVKYYAEAAKHNYNEGRTYQLLSKAYLEMADTTRALTSLQEGLTKFPEDNGILVEMTNIYITTGKTDDAMRYLDLAIEQDPANESFYFVKGSLLDGFGRQEEAIATYERAIELNPAYFNAYYNLGALYYNNGVKQVEVANAVPPSDNARYEAEVAKADVWFSKSLPLMEKCYELEPDDTYAIESLRNLYYRLQMMEKYEAIMKKVPVE